MISTSIDSDGATIGDSGGNVVSDLSFESPTGLSLVRVDTTAPTIESVSIASGTHGGVMDFYSGLLPKRFKLERGPPLSLLMWMDRLGMPSFTPGVEIP